MKKKVKIAFRLIFSFLKNNLEIISRLIFLFLIVCEIVICIYQYRTRPVYGNHIAIDDIEEYDTVLALRYTNDAWGHQDYGFVVNKAGQVKAFNFSNRKVAYEDLLSEFDKVLRDSSIPLYKDKIPISADILQKMVNVEDYKLRRPFLAEPAMEDGGIYTFFSISGSGQNRKKHKMLVYSLGDYIQAKCNDRKINKFCEELMDCSDEILATRKRYRK